MACPPPDIPCSVAAPPNVMEIEAARVEPPPQVASGGKQSHTRSRHEGGYGHVESLDGCV
jgi:hypothetical protein